ncbi:MAG TPA: D-aminoacyl-tRNA deacylase [Geopsychrobacteraceae bacterium]|jgi:D-tyrosyl-tRNA(Tyr) deacylase
MRAVLQRVSSASVTVGDEVIGRIGNGLVVLLGVEQGDTAEDARALAEKTAHLRIFEDSEGKMNLSVQDSGGAVLAISQFTLLADCRKGRRPGFTRAALPELAEPLYERYVAALGQFGLKVATGRFQADMAVALVNDGPVTMLLDSRKCF